MVMDREGPKLQRCHSDPQMAALAPLAARPNSSYEMRAVDKEQAQFTEPVIQAMAKQLGIDVYSQDEFNWLVRDCLLNLAEEQWTAEVGPQGDLAYKNVQTEDCRSFHVTVELYRQLAARLMQNAKELAQKRLNPHYQIKELVYKRILGETDVRRVSDPRVMTEVMHLLKIDVVLEPFLINIVKIHIEDAYFDYVDNPLRITVDTCIDIDKLIVEMSLERIKFLKQISPSGLLYCVESDGAVLADVMCTVTGDCLSNTACVATHATGRRQDFPVVFIEQTVCSECECKAAVFFCEDCHDLFCYDCFKATHKAGKRKKHCVRLAMPTWCTEDPGKEAAYICVETGDVLSPEAAAKIHRSGARQNHTLFGIRKAAYSKKLFADNVDAVWRILQRNIQQDISCSYWYLFYNSALEPEWYNFKERETKKIENGIMGNFLKPTFVNEEEENLEPANYAARSCVFDVPPPVHIKYATSVNIQNGAKNMYQAQLPNLREELEDGLTAGVL